MPRGVVKWFSDSKGFGFLTVEGIEGDVFAHFSDIEMEGFKTLKTDAAVDFELVQTDKGHLAKKITPVIQSGTTGAQASEEPPTSTPA